MRRLTIAMVLACLVASTGCGTRETRWSEAAALQKEQKWAEAAQVYTGIINSSDNERSVAGAYLYRGDSYMHAGKLEQAYRDLLVGEAMSCWITSNDSGYVSSSVGYLAMSEACQTYAPERLKAVKQRLSREQVQRAEAAADILVPDKHRAL